MGGKTGCKLVCEDPIAPMRHTYEISEQHPLLFAAIEDLMIYERWVSRVVMPIAFQWIEENKADVYKNMPPDGVDDIGAVVAAAFEIVKTLPAYKAGHDLADEKPKTCNKIWKPIAQAIHDGTRKAFNSQSALLKETTCLPS